MMTAETLEHDLPNPVSARRLTIAAAVLIVLAALIVFPALYTSTTSARDAGEAARAAQAAATNARQLLIQQSQRSERSECARQIAADQDEAWRHDIADVIVAPTREAANAIALRIANAPSQDDLIAGKIPGTPACPPLPKGTP